MIEYVLLAGVTILIFGLSILVSINQDLAKQGYMPAIAYYLLGSASVVAMVLFIYVGNNKINRCEELIPLIPKDQASAFLDAKYKEKHGPVPTPVPTPAPTPTPDQLIQYINNGIK